MAHVLTALKLVKSEVSNEAAELARELGLELQAKRYEKPLAENVFKELSEDEARIWAHHCPTRYAPGGGENMKKLEDYGFDSVPIEVMRHWKTIKDNYTFDRYEIWTTERTVNTDPLLVGVIGQKLYLLARWGLESPEQLPLRELAQRIYDEALARAERMSSDYPFQPAEKRRASNLQYIKKNWSVPVAAAERYLGKS